MENLDKSLVIIMASRRKAKDKKKVDKKLAAEKRQMELEKNAMLAFNKAMKEKHEETCMCPACRLIKLEIAHNQLVSSMKIIFPWAEKMMKERGEAINPLTSTVVKKEFAEKCNELQTKLVHLLEGEHDLNPIRLFRYENEYGGMMYFMINADEKENPKNVLKIGISNDKEFIESTLTKDEFMNEYYKRLEMQDQETEEQKDKIQNQKNKMQEYYEYNLQLRTKQKESSVA